MKKIGIMSMQRIKNYGSFLQAYALKTMLEELRTSVEFVDYHIDSPLISNSKNKKNLLMKVFKILKDDVPFKQKIQYIKHKKNFSNKYNALLEINQSYNYNPKLDVLIIGSDEVFNCIQSNTNVGYSLELFGKNNNADKLVSYAASFGNTTYDKIKKYNKVTELSNCFKEFDIISVRDNNSKNIIEKMINKNVFLNLDPVLVFDYMNRKEIPNLDIKEKFMIVYAYTGRISKKESEFINKYAKNKGLKVLAIGGAQKCANEFIDCSPFEVLSYFSKAECIVSDTFHGSIFSIINHRPFVTLVRKSKGNSYGNEEKLVDLLDRLQLNHRIISNIEDMDAVMDKKIDYEKTNKIIMNERKKTIDYLKMIVGDIDEK